MLKKTAGAGSSAAHWISDPTGRMVKSVKAKHDALRTLPERVADGITAAFGSVTFLVVNLLWFIVWMVINPGYVPAIKPFDPFPFGLLTMIVSLEAIFLSIFVLLSQNRVSKIDALREEVDLQVDIITEQELTKILELMVLFLNKQGIDVSQDAELQEMLKQLNTTKIEKVLERQIVRG